VREGSPRLLDGLRRAGERVESAIEAAPMATAVIVAALFLAAGLAGASLKEIWYDELHTYALTRLGSLGKIQAALADGADGNRIGFYVATLASSRLLGLGLVSIRLPAVLGFLVFAGCLGIFTARRCGPRAGWVAAAVPYLTGARMYVFEGRQYGLVLGFTGAALLGWQAAGERRRGGRALFAAALLGGAFVSPLMAFSVFALAAGEAWRTVARRKVDWLVCSIFGLAGGALIVSQRLSSAGFNRISGCGGVMNEFPLDRAVVETYGWLLGTWPLVYKTSWLVAAWVAWQVVAALREPDSGPGTRRREEVAGFLPHETAAAISFVLIPFVVFAATRLPRWPYYPRYSIAIAAGLALLVAALFRRLRANGKGTWLSAAGLVALAFWAQAGLVALQRPDPAGPAGLAVLSAVAAGDQRPVVVASAFDYAKYSFYARPELQARMRLLYEPDASQPGFAASGEIVCLFGLAPYWPLRLEAYQEFVRPGGAFILVTPSGEDAWVRARLASGGYRLEARGRAGTSEVLSVEPGAPPAREASAKSTYPP
jgi:hypothetical protein